MLKIQHTINAGVAPVFLLAAALAVGDKAPPLAVEAWLKHRQPAVVQAGKVSVVEFWATWCGPCLANIPHLTSLQKKYASRGLVVIGATSNDKWGNDRHSVESLIAAKGPAFDYAVAWLPESRGVDDVGIFRNPWFRASEVEWLPCAYVIDRNGRIAFIGDPMMVDGVVKAVLDGSFDLSAARSQDQMARQARAMLKDLQPAIDRGDVAGALRVARAITAGPGRNDPRTLLIVADALSKSKPSPKREQLDVALAAAQRSVDLTKSLSPGMLDLLAHVWFLRGDVKKAIEIESRAIQLSEGPMRDAQKKNLDTYRAALRH